MGSEVAAACCEGTAEEEGWGGLSSLVSVKEAVEVAWTLEVIVAVVTTAPGSLPTCPCRVGDWAVALAANGEEEEVLMPSARGARECRETAEEEEEVEGVREEEEVEEGERSICEREEVCGEMAAGCEGGREEELMGSTPEGCV